MPQGRNRLSFRIPWLIEAAAEGPVAILACVVLVIAALGSHALGWW